MGPTWAGQRYGPWIASLVPPELVLQYLDFINQLGELVVGGDGATSGNAGFRDPAQEEELPNSNV